MKPFLLFFCLVSILLTACSKSIQSRVIGTWRLVAYTDASTQRVLHIPTDSTVVLIFHFSTYEELVNNVQKRSGIYRITTPGNGYPYTDLYFDHSVANQIDFRHDTMVLTAQMMTANSPNQLQYVRN